MIEIRGAGISGSYLAYLLASQGYDVRVYEMRKRRDTKPCAGGILPRVLKLVNFKDLESIEIKRVIVDWDGKRVEYEGKKSISVDRGALQVYLRDMAESEGAEIKYGSPHTAFQKNSVKIIASGSDKNGILGVEVHSKTTNIREDGFYFRIYQVASPVRYAWVFPKVDGYSVGLAGDRKWVLENIDLILDRLGASGRRRGAYIGIFRGNAHFRSGGAWVIGDAASLADPLNYEGYTGAFYSAYFLSRNLSNPDFSPLLKYLRREVKIMGFAARYPKLAKKLIRLWLRFVYSDKL